MDAASRRITSIAGIRECSRSRDERGRISRGRIAARYTIGETRWTPSSRERLGLSARVRQLYFFPETSECNGRKNGREGEGERATRTWTLDALRAATEPVKVEAMQAIVEVGCLGGSVWGVLDYVKSAEWRYYLCQLGRFFLIHPTAPQNRSSVVGPQSARAASV